jgi:hypothetical protein
MMTLLESAGDRVRWLARAVTPTGRNRPARYAAAPVTANAPAAGVDTSKDPVAIHESVGGYTGPLCETVTVQVEFWKLNYGSAGAGEHTTSATEAPPDYYFDMDSVLLYADDRSVCVGALVAVVRRQTPQEQGTARADQHRVRGRQHRRRGRFRTERVAEYELSPPAAPQACIPRVTEIEHVSEGRLP